MKKYRNLNESINYNPDLGMEKMSKQVEDATYAKAQDANQNYYNKYWFGGYKHYQDLMQNIQNADVPVNISSEELERLKADYPDNWQEILSHLKAGSLRGYQRGFDDYKKDHKVEAFVYENPKTTAGIGLGAAAALGYGAYRLANRNKNRNQMINQL